jgi:hypothetical protein
MVLFSCLFPFGRSAMVVILEKQLADLQLQLKAKDEENQVLKKEKYAVAHY